MAVLELFVGSKREVLMGRVQPAAGQQPPGGHRDPVAEHRSGPVKRGGAFPGGSMLIGPRPPIRSLCARQESTGSACDADESVTAICGPSSLDVNYPRTGGQAREMGESGDTWPSPKALIRTSSTHTFGG